MLIQDMTMADFSAGLLETRTVVIPCGSVEEHGPHLPLATDTIQPFRVAQSLAERRPLFVAPPIPYGVCRSSRQHPGTISITTETLKSLAVDLVKDMHRQGLRAFVLLSGHAGGTHLAALIDAGESLLETLPDIQIAVLNEFMLAGNRCDNIIETKDDSHAGEIETSRLLFTDFEQVRENLVPKAERPDFPEQGILVRDKLKCWPGGVWGDPQKASKEKGRRLHNALVDALEELVEKLESRCA